MANSAQDAGKFVQELSSLAHRLSSKNIVVARFDVDWAIFGSWLLWAQNGEDTDRFWRDVHCANPMQVQGPDVLQVCWDGKEQILSVDTSPTRGYSGPHEWKREFEKRGDDLDGEMLTFVEDYLTKRLALLK